MGQEIAIKAGGSVFEAELNETVTGKAIYEALPIQAKAQRWGGEIYFNISMTADPETDSRDILEVGELGYWPPGSAFCVFFGPTPLSHGNEIRAASAVNVIGKLKSDWSGLWDVNSGDKIVIEIA